MLETSLIQSLNAFANTSNSLHFHGGNAYTRNGGWIAEINAKDNATNDEIKLRASGPELDLVLAELWTKYLRVTGKLPEFDPNMTLEAPKVNPLPEEDDEIPF